MIQSDMCLELGNPAPLSASLKARAVLKAQTAERYATVRPLLKQLKEQGYSLSAIAQELNRRNVPTARGGLWYATTVRNILTLRRE